MSGAHNHNHKQTVYVNKHCLPNRQNISESKIDQSIDLFKKYILRFRVYMLSYFRLISSKSVSFR